MQYKNGDKVIVKDHVIGRCSDRDVTFVPSMQKMVDYVLTLKSYYPSENYFTVEENNFNWSECMFSGTPKYWFKVGDKVKIVTCGNTSSHKGIEVIIDAIYDDSYRVKHSDGGFCIADEVELIKKNTTEKPKREEVNTMQEIKAGDKVMLNAGMGFCFVGEGTIEKCSSSGCKGSSIHALSPRGSLCHCDIEKATLISSANTTMTNLIALTKGQEEGLKDDDKSMLELGLINDKLEPTEAGFAYLRAYLFAVHRDALAIKAGKEVKEIKKELKEKAK